MKSRNTYHLLFFNEARWIIREGGLPFILCDNIIYLDKKSIALENLLEIL
jgi:hypothetical protein